MTATTTAATTTTTELQRQPYSGCTSNPIQQLDVDDGDINGGNDDDDRAAAAATLRLH